MEVCGEEGCGGEEECGEEGCGGEEECGLEDSCGDVVVIDNCIFTGECRYKLLLYLFCPKLITKF